MTAMHPLLGSIDVPYVSLHPLHREWLTDWLVLHEQNVECGDISMSSCVCAAIAELALTGRIQTDWIGVLDEYLGGADEPIAYSAVFIERLHKFAAQGYQPTLTAAYSRWWLMRQSGAEPDHDLFSSHVLSRLQPDGLFYDANVSETTLRHRMKLELTLNANYAIEILNAAHRIDEEFAIQIASAITNTKFIPSNTYLSTEYFRFKSLEQLNLSQLFPTGFEDFVVRLEEGLEVGWSDFYLGSKTDAYMGTAKRTSRDKLIHSPLISNYVMELRDLVVSAEGRINLDSRLAKYSQEISSRPLSIPSFLMRDLPIPFGTGISVLEAVTASHLATIV